VLNLADPPGEIYGQVAPAGRPDRAEKRR